MKIPDQWFEVYKIRPWVFAIYEPHQAEEVISYLVIGTQKAVLFDTGMGISNIKAVVEGLTKLPISLARMQEDQQPMHRLSLRRDKSAELCQRALIPSHTGREPFISLTGCMTATGSI